MTVATTKVSRNGQVVIPKQVRDRLRLTAGDTLVVAEVDGRVVLSPVRTEDLRSEFADVMAAFDRAIRGERFTEAQVVAAVRRVRRGR
jgi:AbrB family looped-hinge helix DNA binding protein